MNRKYLMMAAFALALAGCAKDSEMTESPVNPTKNNTEVAKQPVQFGAYVNRATTRAGDPGVLVTSGAAPSDAGQINLQDKGFGVIAYYTDDDLYSPIYQPNFMYNTKVSGADWLYSPVQYWPNEFGANAVSEGVDRLSFFAYAPYVDVTTNTGIVEGDATSGIVGLSRNAAVGDPFVKYYVNLDPTKQVDFCWGKPKIDMTKQGINEKVSFEFNHALAALNVQIDAMIDELTPGTNTLIDDKTHIFVRSVTFEGFVTKGAFNLNSNTATWYDLAGANYIDGGAVTVFDGRTNGREGQSESVNEAPTGLNPEIVQSVPYTDNNLAAGVTNQAVNLFKGGTTAPIYVIPSGQPLNVTIVYDVETETDELAGYLSDGETHGTSVENKITKTITLNGQNLKLEAGKQYTLTLHLGMTSVKFDAEVAEWGTGSTVDANLPDNTGTPVAVTGVVVDKSTLNLLVSDTEPLVATVKPAGATNKNVTWSSENESIATVDENGVVTGVAIGNTIVHATTEDGGYEATITVNVTDKPMSLASLKKHINQITPSDYEGIYYVKRDGVITNNGHEENVVGILARIIRSGTSPYMVDRGPEGTDTNSTATAKHILVLSTADVPGGPYQWSTSQTAVGWTHAQEIGEEEFYGLNLTLKMMENRTVYPAGAAAWYYTSDGCSTGYGLMDADRNTADIYEGKWFLPSVGQMKTIGFIGDNVPNITKAALNRLIQDGFFESGDNTLVYWPSTEVDAGKGAVWVWNYSFPSNPNSKQYHWIATGLPKTEAHQVRPVFVY